MGTKKVTVRLLLPQNIDSSAATLLLRNIKISRSLDNSLFLKKISSDSSSLVSYEKVNPTIYVGKIKIDKPSFILFKETFNPGWVLKLKNDKESFTVKN